MEKGYCGIKLDLLTTVHYYSDDAAVYGDACLGSLAPTGKRKSH